MKSVLPDVLDPELVPEDAIERGAYILRDTDGDPALVLIGTVATLAVLI